MDITYNVVITTRAELSLDEIFLYYSTFSTDTAQKMIDKLLKRMQILRNFPLAGAIESLLTHKGEYRYLVEGNYKIIYFVRNEDVIIADIFDTRQNPEKMESIS
jgi:toxin ParE1/3/4